MTTTNASGTADVTVTGAFHVARRGRGGRKNLCDGPAVAVPVGRVPRVARLIALAIRFKTVVRSGAVTDHATLTRLGHVTRARVSQIISLQHLAPHIQEALLFRPLVTRGRDPIVVRDLLPVAATADWAAQGKRWRALRTNSENRPQPT